MITGKKMIDNGIIADVREISSAVGSLQIYEVFRVMEGTCLFLEDHLQRLFNSARLAGEKIPVSEAQLFEMMKELVQANGISEGNIKLVFEFAGRTERYSAFFIPHQYPTSDQYTQGVKLKALKINRPNPNAKIWHAELKSQVEAIMTDASVYEVALVDGDGFLTEGSRSNLFFVKDDMIVTAPHNKVLPGITRRYVLQSCLRLKFDILEECLHYRDLRNIQGAFVSGTSPKVLPISAIDQQQISVSSSMLSAIMKEYDEIVKEYLNKRNV